MGKYLFAWQPQPCPFAALHQRWETQIVNVIAEESASAGSNIVPGEEYGTFLEMERNFTI